MNKAITEGVQLMPPAFSEGLDVWSSGDGTPGSGTYDGAANAALVPSDADFGGCLELVKTDGTQKLRWTGQTPVTPGCYLQVSARVKAVSGNLPGVRIAAWAGQAGGAHAPGLVETGPEVTLTSYGEVVELRAIIGTGARGGVDMAWGLGAAYAHVGLDLTGLNGGVVRIDDIRVEDVTAYWLREMASVVDVRDFGALGDGVTDDRAAFEAADAAAAGRRLLVPAGDHYIGGDLTLASQVIAEGTLTMPDSAILSLVTQYDLATYIALMGSEEAGLRKALQSLFNNADHESLDMGGRRVTITRPLDLAAIVANKTTYAQRRILRNGQIYVSGDSEWQTEVVTSQASYSTSDEDRLTNVVNAANIPVGALVEGAGVGREVYVRAVNVGAQEITLSQPLYDAAGTQTYTFRRFKYLLDCSGFAQLSKFGLENLELQCNSTSSGVMLAPSGSLFHMHGCHVTRPKDRGLTSIGEGCQGMLVDRCHFVTPEGASVPAQDRVSIALNANANDVKLRHNWASQFRHFAILSGSNALILGNHFYQGDQEAGGVRLAGIALARANSNTTISGNYIDNCTIEWTNEHDAEPAYTSGFGFSALSVTNNVFLSGDVAPWFAYLVVKPYGPNHSISGLTVTGNTFRSMNGTIDRVERVDTAHADLDYSRFRDFTIAGNTFNNVESGFANPVVLRHVQAGDDTVWRIDAAPFLPFGGRARRVTAIAADGPIRNAANQKRHDWPYAEAQKGADASEVELRWPEAVHGEVLVTVHVDG